MSQSAAIAFVLEQEGPQLVSDSNDPGGLSRFGVALKRHPELSAIDIENMSAQRAGGIYAAQYWPQIYGDDLASFIQLPMLDSCVNQGPGVAMLCLQRALHVPCDGKFGPQTSAAVEHANPQNLLAAFTAQRLLSYSRDKDWASYGAGWAKRAVLAALNA